MSETIHFKFEGEVCKAEYEWEDDSIILYEFYPGCSVACYYELLTDRAIAKIETAIQEQFNADGLDIRDDYLDKRIPNSHFIGSI